VQRFGAFEVIVQFVKFAQIESEFCEEVKGALQVVI
jgi:hypothetical protein